MTMSSFIYPFISSSIFEPFRLLDRFGNNHLAILVQCLHELWLAFSCVNDQEKKCCLTFWRIFGLFSRVATVSAALLALLSFPSLCCLFFLSRVFDSRHSSDVKRLSLCSVISIPCRFVVCLVIKWIIFSVIHRIYFPGIYKRGIYFYFLCRNVSSVYM